jgi:ribosomal protein L7/L12
MPVTLLYALAAMGATGALLWLAMRKGPPDEEPTMARIHELVATGKRIEAIKMYRRMTGVSLQDAKDFVAQITSPQKRPTPPSEEDIDRAITAGEIIRAIKLHRELFHSGLKEAKDAVEERARQLGVSSR